jgi:hypothetical protein
MSDYNLFRRKDCDAVYCAVPEDRVVPSFLTGTHWRYAGKLEPETSRMPASFDGAAARAAVCLDGFYLFRQVAESDVRNASPPAPPSIVAREPQILPDLTRGRWHEGAWSVSLPRSAVPNDWQSNSNDGTAPTRL